MREFSKISPKVWTSQKFRGLPNDQIRLFYLYLLTSQHQVSAGVYRLPHEYAATDLGWSVDETSNCMKAVCDAGLVHRDENTTELFIARWFVFNAPMNEKHATGIGRTLSEIESEPLREMVQEAFDVADAERLAKAGRKQRAKELAIARRAQGYQRDGGTVTNLTETALMRRSRGGS